MFLDTQQNNKQHKQDKNNVLRHNNKQHKQDKNNVLRHTTQTTQTR